MQKTRFDSRVSDLFERAPERIGDFQPNHPIAARLVALALEILAEGPRALDVATASALRENHEVYLATQRARDAETRCEDSYESLYHALRAQLYAVLTSDRDAGGVLEQEMERALGGLTPAAFRALGLDRTLVAIDGAIAFAPRVLAPDHANLVAAREAAEALRQARRELDREAGESLQAMRALEAARDSARVHYIAARRTLAAGLALEQRDADLGRLMPPFRKPNTSSRSTDDDLPVAPEAPATPEPPR